MSPQLLLAFETPHRPRPRANLGIGGAAGPAIVILVSLVSVLNASCGADDDPPVAGNAAATLAITSSAFSDGGPIPVRHTCDGVDLSPALSWRGAPDSTKSLALICDDPDAPGGTWVHWVLFNLPATLTSLPEGVSAAVQPASGGRQGLNDFDRPGYGGPCPPPGKPHRYFFKLYALDTKLDLAPGATKRDVEKAMKDHVLAAGRLMGTYER